jgi:hypothetical protein
MCLNCPHVTTTCGLWKSEKGSRDSTLSTCRYSHSHFRKNVQENEYNRRKVSFSNAKTKEQSSFLCCTLHYNWAMQIFQLDMETWPLWPRLLPNDQIKSTPNNHLQHDRQTIRTNGLFHQKIQITRSLTTGRSRIQRSPGRRPNSCAKAQFPLLVAPWRNKLTLYGVWAPTSYNIL